MTPELIAAVALGAEVALVLLGLAFGYGKLNGKVDANGVQIAKSRQELKDHMDKEEEDMKGLTTALNDLSQRIARQEGPGG